MEEMKLTFVNVGYGEAILLECPVEHKRPFVLLIDGGSGNPEEYRDNASGRIPAVEYLKQSGLDHIDWMVSTHTHEDHICGQLEAARLLPPSRLYQSLSVGYFRKTRPLDPEIGRTMSHRNFLRALNDYGTLCALTEKHGGRVLQLLAGQELTPCPGLRISVLAPQPAQTEDLERRMRALYAAAEREEFLKRLTDLDARMNNFSVMLRLDWHGTRILLPGDTNRLGYGAVDHSQLPAHLFKVGHHGQIDGADAELLDAIRPNGVVCCASSDRRYNSAHPELLRLIREKGADLWFSDTPPAPDTVVPPHHALVFTVGTDGSYSGNYQ